MTINTAENPLFDQRLTNALDGLEPYYMKHLKTKVSKTNALTIADYILAMRVETNLSDDHRKSTITSLKLVSQFHDNKPFREMTRDDILAYMDSMRKSEVSDPKHKWIGTYNHRLIDILRFFKWLYSPNIESSKRTRPKVIENIPKFNMFTNVPGFMELERLQTEVKDIKSKTFDEKGNFIRPLTDEELDDLNKP